ncbi:hypothetical protein [Kluyvera sichuanensis]
MTSTNQQMTSEQLAELMVVAVSMQRDAEKLDERPVAVFAYAVQLALAELQQAKQQLLELSVKLANVESKCVEVVVENAGLKAAVGAVNGTAEECEVNGDEFKYVVEPSEFEALIDLLDETPATDAYLAEVRVQVWIEAKALAKSAVASDSIDHIDFLFDGKAAKLRQGAEQ